jgi:hypothetical protein
MSQDFLKQLNTKKPTVPPRTDELNQQAPVQPNPVTSQSGYLDTHTQVIETTRSSLLMENSMHRKFSDRCHTGGIIRACWVEAALTLAEADPELMKRIEDLAKELTYIRKEQADDRRRVTMYENRKK